MNVSLRAVLLLKQHESVTQEENRASSKHLRTPSHSILIHLGKNYATLKSIIMHFVLIKYALNSLTESVYAPFLAVTVHGSVYFGIFVNLLFTVMLVLKHIPCNKCSS